jgi:hypothetical protein
MKKECAYTRKALRKYLRGHLFMLQKNRVERHLKSCVVCSSEYQALKKNNETRQILKDVAPPEGLVKAGVSGLAKLQKLFYRPLWVAAIIGIAVVVFINVTQRPRDLEIENLEKSLPPVPASSSSIASAPATTLISLPAQTAPVHAAAAPQPAPVPEAAAAEPLVIAITPEDEQAAIRRINEVMRGHGSLHRLRFTDTVREISGSLTAKELLTFFNRIETVGKVSYSRKRFESFPAARPIPFVMKLKPAPRIVVQPSTPTAPKTDKPAGTTAQPISAPTQTPHP